MMIEQTSILIQAETVIAVTAIICLAALKAWRGWLDLKRLEIASLRPAADTVGRDSGMRIEMADLKERLRKLEAIAIGVDL
jgi:hypothetical protein